MADTLLEEVVRLLQEAARWKDAAMCLSDVVRITEEREAKAEDALAECREDAERYRWLRNLDGACDSAACVNINIGFDWIEQHGPGLDAAIDAARAKERDASNISNST